MSKPSSEAAPEIEVLAPHRQLGIRAVVLIMHGGSARSHVRASRFRLAYLRMLPFAEALRPSVGPGGLAVWRLRYRYRGWNGPDRDPVHDVEWALGEGARRHPGCPVVLIGHSMGGRAALWAAGAENVAGVCALAPWIEPSDPVGQLQGRKVLLAHGTRDRITDPAATQRYASVAARSGVDTRLELIEGAGHTMLRHASRWHDLASAFVHEVTTV